MKALAAAARVEPREYGRTLVALTDALEQYWIVKNGIGGYAVLPRGSERYYDDNAIMTLSLLDAYESSKQRKYLLKAVTAFDFVASGEKVTPGGGIRQHEDKEGRVAVCATAPAMLAALRLHQFTKDKRYLPLAKRWHAVLISPEANVRGSDGLFHETREGNRGYLSAWVLQADLLLHAIEGDKQYLDEAQQIAAAAIKHWIQPDGSLKETGQWGGSDLSDALVALSAADGDPRWQNTVFAMLQRLHEKGRDRNNRYGEYWHEDRRDQELDKFKLLHMAPVARAYWVAGNVKQE